MANLPPLPLASIEAMRPVFLIVMGLSILLIAWRLTRQTHGWSSRILMAGALLLAFGYSVVIPLYQAEILLPLNFLPFRPDANESVVMGWHLAKLFAMNGGWLLLGLGLALHARVFQPITARRAAVVSTSQQSEPFLG